MIADIFSGWFWHPLTNGPGYNFWSGIAGSFFSSWWNPWYIVIAFTVWRAHNCHVKHCWRIKWHVDPAHGHPVCRKHHPDGEIEL